MEPEARYQLHDEIQLQLAQRGHYRVRYTLHAGGRCACWKRAKAYKQHNRQLLRGYLTVIDDQQDDTATSTQTISSPATTACNWPCSSTSAPSRSNSNTWSGCAPSRT
jgi:hypothetical protein